MNRPLLKLGLPHQASESIESPLAAYYLHPLNGIKRPSCIDLEDKIESKTRKPLQTQKTSYILHIFPETQSLQLQQLI